jgi:hypothetical protein
MAGPRGADWHVGEELAPAPLHEKGIDAFVRGAVPRTEREKAARVEVGIAHRCRQRGAVPNPAQELGKIARVPALDGTAVKLAEHAAPVPLAHLLLCPTAKRPSISGRFL